MDNARSFIAHSSNRDEGRIEKVDTVLAAVEVLQGSDDFVCNVTIDADVGESVVTALR